MAKRELEEIKELFEKNKRVSKSQKTDEASMTIPEFATLLVDFQTQKKRQRDKEKYKCATELDERTIRNYICKICSDSKADLNKNRDDPTKVSRYVIEPDIQSLMMILCDSQYCGGHSYNNNLEARAELYSRLISNIDDYLCDEDKAVLRQRIEYRNAVSFVKSVNQITKIYQEIQNEILTSDSLVEGKLMSDLVQCLSQYSQHIKKINEEAKQDHFLHVCRANGSEELSRFKFSHRKLHEFLLDSITAAVKNEPLENTNEDFFFEDENSDF